MKNEGRVVSRKRVLGGRIHDWLGSGPIGLWVGEVWRGDKGRGGIGRGVDHFLKSIKLKYIKFCEWILA